MSKENSKKRKRYDAYVNEYKREHYKKFEFRIKNEKKELINYINSKPNKTQYIINLIEEDMKKHKNSTY